VATQLRAGVAVRMGKGIDAFFERVGSHLIDTDRSLGPQVGAGITYDAPTLLVSWGANWLTSQGGIYRLCWCGHPTACDASEEFRTDSGMLMVVGPAPLIQGRTCISGQTCVVDGFLGTGIKDGDHMMVAAGLMLVLRERTTS
jgi:hypothetical protein